MVYLKIVVLLKTVEIVILIRRRDFANEVNDTVMDEEERKEAWARRGIWAVLLARDDATGVAWV